MDADGTAVGNYGVSYIHVAMASYSVRYNYMYSKHVSCHVINDVPS